MADFQTMLDTYQKREKSALIDTIATGLSFADEMSVDLGLLSETGLATELLETVSLGLPFAIVAVTEGTHVLLKKKTPKAGAQDAAYRLVKTGAAIGAGAAVAASGVAGAALPVAVGVRVLLDKYRSRALTGHRVQQRIQRVEALRRQRESRLNIAPGPALITEA